MIGLEDGEESSFLFSFLALTLYVTCWHSENERDLYCDLTFRSALLPSVAASNRDGKTTA